MTAIAQKLALAVYRAAPPRIRRRLLTKPIPSVHEIHLPLDLDSLVSPVRFPDPNVSRGIWAAGWRGLSPFDRVFLHLARVVTGPVIDLGANYGYYSVLAAAIREASITDLISTIIISVEPVPEAVDAERQILAANGFVDRVHLVEAAIGAQPGTAVFYLPDWSLSRVPNIGSLVNRFGPGNRYADREARQINVSVRTLDETIATEADGRVGMIKFYVEQLEVAVLQSGAESIKRQKPSLIGWLFDLDQAAALEPLLKNEGYQIYGFVEPADGATAPGATPRLTLVNTFADLATAEIGATNRGFRWPMVATTEPYQLEPFL